MKLLDDVCHMESCLGPFRELFVLVQDGTRFAPNAPEAKKPFWTHLMVLLVKELKLKLGLVCLEIVLILRKDSCTVCMECTICSEINLDAPDGTP